MYVGVILSTVGIALLALLTSANGAYVAFALFSAGTVWNPTIQGSIARATPPEKQGSMQSALASILALGMAMAPIPFAKLFEATQYTASSSVCWLALLIIVTIVVLTFRTLWWSPTKNRYHAIFYKPKNKKAADARE